MSSHYCSFTTFCYLYSLHVYILHFMSLRSVSNRETTVTNLMVQYKVAIFLLYWLRLPHYTEKLFRIVRSMCTLWLWTIYRNFEKYVVWSTWIYHLTWWIVRSRMVPELFISDQWVQSFNEKTGWQVNANGLLFCLCVRLVNITYNERAFAST